MAPTSESTGKTSETPAKASTPSLAMKYISASGTEICVTMTTAFGAASFSKVRKSGASNNARVRTSISVGNASDAVAWALMDR
jgi:hypothetical protein